VDQVVNEIFEETAERTNRSCHLVSVFLTNSLRPVPSRPPDDNVGQMNQKLLETKQRLVTLEQEGIVPPQWPSRDFGHHQDGGGYFQAEHDFVCT
jgi:hypothetical protein